MKYDPRLDLKEAWGNLIGFKKDPGEQFLRRRVVETLKFGAFDTSDISGRVGKLMPSDVRVRPPFYVNFANRLRRKSPMAFRILQVSRRFLAGALR